MKHNNTEQDIPKRPMRGIYILPNFFTSMNIFCGFYAVISSVNGRFTAAAVSILIALVFDSLDGKIARATKTTSQFGIEYDSLADLISFGLAPGLLIYLWALQPLGRIGWLAAFLFLICGALRLARFNTQTGSVDGNYFVGLPIPAGAGMNAVIVLFCHRLGMGDNISPVLMFIIMNTLSFLMVSTIKYNSFKKPELFKKMNFNVLVGAVIIFIFIAAEPSLALFLMGFIYIISGPFASLKFYKNTKYNTTKRHDPNKKKTDHI
ncbi:MAG TPA: CDP-diacylglycerol--serine O-phosphatidyltransferase [Desulfobacteraceae bacterium]|nr:CDP-diacylglycerol--serine O-phosphatidyltransferase [Desulfobacteraceae bacterium]